MKNIFHKLIFSYIAIISIILFVSSIVMYRGYKDQMLDQSGIISEKLLNQAEYYSEFTLRWAVSYVYQLYLDQGVYNLMFSSNMDSKTEGIQKIKQTGVIHPSIQSVYVYSNQDKMIYPSDGNPTYFSLYDRDLEKILKENKETVTTRFIPRKILKSVNGHDYEKDVLTLVLKNVDASDNGLPYGAIILNLDATDVQNYYKNITEKDYSILAVDDSGRIVLNSDPNLFLEDISGRDYVKKILDSKEAEGRFLATINGKPSIVTYKTSSRLGLKFINVIPYETLTGSINNMLKLLINTSVVLLLLGIAIAFVLFKRIYSPIDRTFKTIREYMNANVNTGSETAENEAAVNETADLSKIVEIIINQPLSLKKLSGADLNFIKKQLLSGLLFNTSLEINNFKNKLLELDVNMDFNHIVILLMKIDSYKDFENEHGKEECEELINTAYMEAQKAMERYFKCEAVITDEDEFSVILSLKGPMDDEMMNHIIEITTNVVNGIYDHQKISVSAAIGDYVYDIEETAKSYKSAREYINYRLKYGLGSILFKNKILSGISADGKYDEDVEESVFKELKAGNMAKVEAELNRMFEIIKKMSYRDMQLAISRLTGNSQRVINSIAHLNGSSMNMDTEDITGQANKLHTVEEVNTFLLEVYRNTVGQLKEKKKNRKNEIIESVLNYIHENYSYSLLSADMIAGNMRLSPNYLRLLFKDTEGKSLSSYINEVRFENAKCLLETTELTVSEIAAKVGFTNDNYFYTAFKKYYGVSPNQYRNSTKS